MATVESLVKLLDEVRCCFTTDEDLPNNLLPRIDAAIMQAEAEQKQIAEWQAKFRALGEQHRQQKGVS